MKKLFPLLVLVLLGAGCATVPAANVAPVQTDPYEGWGTIEPGSVVSLRIPPGCSGDPGAGSIYVICPTADNPQPTPEFVTSSDGIVVNIRTWEGQPPADWDKIIDSLRVLTPVDHDIEIHVEGIGDEGTSSQPPVIGLKAGDVSVPGVQGSYCYAGTCVDKIAPVDLVAEAHLGYTPILRDNNQIVFDAPFNELDIDWLDTNGNPFPEYSHHFDGGMLGDTYMDDAPDQLPAGNYLLLIGAQLQGGDVSYIFPVSLPACSPNSPEGQCI